MLPRLTSIKRGRGQWVAEVPGYGVLPVVHSDCSDFKGRRYRAEFDEAAERSSKFEAHLRAFEDNPGFVLVQRDRPRETADEAYQADGYLGVYAITGFVYDRQRHLLQFNYVKREPVRLA